MFLNIFARMFSDDLAIDLGTASTRVYVRGQGIVLNEPSIVAIHQADNSILAVGHEAKAMLGSSRSIVAIRPLKGGVIADFDVTVKMLYYFIIKVHGHRTLVRPRVVIGVPSGITQVEKRAVRDSAMAAGAREVYLIEGPMAAAIGAGLPIQEPGGNMIVDIGAGTTEVATISLSEIVYCKSVRIAGDEMDEAILQYLKKYYNLLVGERRAEEIKIALGSACPGGMEPPTIEVKGRDLITGFPTTIKINEQEVREALREPVMTIVETVRTCLEHTPPGLAAGIMDKGIILTGGGALLRGLDRLLQLDTNLPVTVSDVPLSCVALGIGKVLDELDQLRRVTAGRPPSLVLRTGKVMDELDLPQKESGGTKRTQGPKVTTDKAEGKISQLKNIVTEGRKKMPQDTVLHVRAGSAPGTVTIGVQVPGQETWTLYADLNIHEGTVAVPVKLAFLLHAKEDAEFVRDLAVRLLRDGILTWFDEKDLLPGDDWKRRIDDGIEKSDFVLVFLSSTSITKTGYFQRELKYALEQHQTRPEGARYIIPIIIDDCEPPSSLRNIHWVRTRGPSWYEILKRALLS